MKKSAPAARRFAATALAVGLAGAAVAGCSDMPNTTADDNVAEMGDASPAPSPKDAHPAGDVIDFSDITDIEAAGEYIAVRTADTLTIGSTADFKAKKTTAIDVDTQCGDLTPTDAEFVLACGNRVRIFDAADPTQERMVTTEEAYPVTAAALTSSGELFVSTRNASEVAVYKDDKRIDDFKVQAPTDQLVAVRNQDGTDNVVRVWRADTTIQNLDWENSREGGRLRVGQGVGLISSGNHGVLVAADTEGKRVAIYTSEDVIRLHQFGNTDGTPWATAWDDSRQLAWVTTTDNNKAQAFRIASGVPESQGQVDTVADAQHMAVTEDGVAVFGSATGAGLQIVSDPKLDA